MRFYEFEAKHILAKRGIPVNQGKVAKTAADAERIAAELGCPVTLKAQVLSPALIKSGARALAANAAQAKEEGEKLFALDDGGRGPNGVLVEPAAQVAAEYSVAVTYDGSAKRPVMVAGAVAGNIEDIAEEHPDSVVRRHFSALLPFSDYLAKELVAGLGLSGSDLNRMAGIVSRLARLFLDYDLTQADISRLAKLEDGKFIALDCYGDMEVEGRPRPKPLLEELGIAPEDPRAVREPTQFELDGAKIDEDDPRGIDRKSTRLNSSHIPLSRMPSSA